MNSSSGLGQPSAGQPDFDGPQDDHAFQRPTSGPGSAATPQQPDGQPWGSGGQPGPQGSERTPSQFGSAPGYEPPGQYGQPGQNPPGQYGQPGQYGHPGQYSPPGQFGQHGQTGYGSPPGDHSNPSPTQGPAGWGPPPSGGSGQQYRPGANPPAQQQPPAGPPPGKSRGRALIITGAIAAVVVIALLGWQLLAARTTPAPTASAQATAAASTAPASSEPTVVRTAESPQPTTSSDVIGGGVGQPIRYQAANGEAQVTVTEATWADNGLLEPDEGKSYLIVDVTFEAISGTVSTGPFFTRVVDGAGDSHLLTVGAELTSFLSMKTLAVGEQNTGQVGFEVARGPVTFEVLSEALEPVAKVDIPG